MKKSWSLQDAKNKFSQVVEDAQKDGPQIITKRGVEAVIVLSIADYKRLTKPETNIVDFFRQSPLYRIALDLERNKEPSRKVTL